MEPLPWRLVFLPTRDVQPSLLFISPGPRSAPASWRVEVRDSSRSGTSPRARWSPSITGSVSWEISLLTVSAVTRDNLHKKIVIKSCHRLDYRTSLERRRTGRVQDTRYSSTRTIPAGRGSISPAISSTSTTIVPRWYWLVQGAYKHQIIYRQSLVLQLDQLFVFANILSCAMDVGYLPQSH